LLRKRNGNLKRLKGFNVNKILGFFISVLAFPSIANNVSTEDGIELSGTEFPWELVIDRGKIQGCIYDNKFYSVGSILIEETLPRKCELNSVREGFWSELSETELIAFEESMKAEQEKTKTSVSIGDKPITANEAAIIRYIRRTQAREAKKAGN